jgi:hypothetical protein
VIIYKRPLPLCTADLPFHTPPPQNLNHQERTDSEARTAEPLDSGTESLLTEHKGASSGPARGREDCKPSMIGGPIMADVMIDPEAVHSVLSATQRSDSGSTEMIVSNFN